MFPPVVIMHRTRPVCCKIKFLVADSKSVSKVNRPVGALLMEINLN